LPSAKVTVVALIGLFEGDQDALARVRIAASCGAVLLLQITIFRLTRAHAQATEVPERTSVSIITDGPLVDRG
jgi:hypothetical protein